jgi:glucose-1-phosphate thymidylyltransferase
MNSVELMKGILLAGGSGTRLAPLTKSLSKQILPIYDKPMIYYPLSTLLQANIREILIISTPRDLPHFKALLGDGTSLGLELTYQVQDKPRGIADAFIIGEDFIGTDSVALMLGDNVFCGKTFEHLLSHLNITNSGAQIFGYYVNNPSQYGVVEFDNDLNILSIEEKPSSPKSNFAIPGLYIYDHQVIDIARNIVPSKRGELEITAVNKAYLASHQLTLTLLPLDTVWFDTGTFKGLLEAANFICNLQKETQQYVGCIEEIAYLKGYIKEEQLRQLTNSLPLNDYDCYLKKLFNRSCH